MLNIEQLNIPSYGGAVPVNFQVRGQMAEKFSSSPGSLVASNYLEGFGHLQSYFYGQYPRLITKGKNGDENLKI